MSTPNPMSLAWSRAAEGRGCDHCPVGRPIEYIKTRGGRVIKLCLECVLRWFPGRTVAWWEERHAPYSDHVTTDAMTWRMRPVRAES